MSTYNTFTKRGDIPYFFDTDKKILVDPHNLLSPIKDEDVPWFSTRYPVKVMLQPVFKGAPAIIGQTPLSVHLTRGKVEYGTVFTFGDEHPFFVVPRLDVTPGPVRVTIRDGLGNIVLQFDTNLLDQVPEYPGFIPVIYSNPNSVRVPDEGERIIKQPYGRTIRLQRDPSLFITDDVPDGTNTILLSLDYGSLPLGTYYGCNRLLIKLPNAATVSCNTATITGAPLDDGWNEGKITVFPDGTCKISFN